MDKLSPRGLDATGLADGTYRLEVVGGHATAWVEVVDGVQTIVPGYGITVDATDLANPIVTALTPLVTVVAGIPGLVFDNDGQIVFTEGA